MEQIGILESAEAQMKPVKCGIWPAFLRVIFSVHFLVNTFHRKKDVCSDGSVLLAECRNDRIFP